MKNAQKKSQILSHRLVFVLICGLLGLAATAPMAALPASHERQAAKNEAGTPALNGPKMRIAVGAFAGDTSGMADELITELVKTGRFIVVERTHMDGMNQEQDLATRNLITKETASQTGQLLGAELVISGNVTITTEAERHLSFAAGGINRFLDNSGVGLIATACKVTLEVRLIDPGTGQIVNSLHAQGKASAHGATVQVDKKQINAGGDQMPQTPVAEASRKAIQQAVAGILQKTQSSSGTGPAKVFGQVVDVIDGQVYINRGADSGLRAGDTLSVTVIVKQLVDPATGQPLGNVERQAGELRIESVNEKYSIAMPVGQFETKTGDLVRVKPRG